MRRGKGLCIQRVDLNLLPVPALSLSLHSLVPEVLQCGAPTVLLICRIVLLLSAVRNTGPFKHIFSTHYSLLLLLPCLRWLVGLIGLFLIRIPSVDFWNAISSTLLNHLTLFYLLFSPEKSVKIFGFWYLLFFLLLYFLIIVAIFFILLLSLLVFGKWEDMISCIFTMRLLSHFIFAFWIRRSGWVLHVEILPTSSAKTSE